MGYEKGGSICNIYICNINIYLYLSGILYFMFTINDLFSCLHLLINSERLLSNIS